MIRRFREHIAKQNWFAVGIDLAIVVVGVFLGTQANNWNQGRSDRAEAREFRTQIADNLRANEADMAARTHYYEQVRAHAVAALTALQLPDGSLGEPFLIDAYQASQVWLRPFEHSAYDDLIASGVAPQIGDAPTRAELSAYYIGARGFEANGLGFTSYRERLRRAMDLNVQEKIRNDCDDIVRTLPGGVQAPLLPDSCKLDLDPRAVASAVTKLKAVPELDQDLTRLVGDIDQKLGIFTRTKREAIHLRTRFE